VHNLSHRGLSVVVVVFVVGPVVVVVVFQPGT
jgi:hypothetical protein